MWNDKGQLIIITAPSGAGKTTLIKKLIKKDKSFTLSISYTTRKPRVGEKNGVDYNFLTEKEFLIKKDEDFFAEWALVHGNYYGTGKQDSYDLRQSGQTVLFDVDYQGALNLQKALPEALSIFILPPSLEELKRRLTDRNTDSQEVIDRRIKNAQKEIYYAKYFDFLLINDNLKIAFDTFSKIIELNRLNVSKNGKLLEPFINHFLRGSWK